MAKPGTVTGWKLSSDERLALLERFPPRYENVIADHVTLRVGATPETPLPRKAEARIVGRADDEDSLECLVVELDGRIGHELSSDRWDDMDRDLDAA